MWIGTEAHPRESEQRKPAYDAEVRHVAMPPERRTWLVLRDERVIDGIGRYAHQRCDPHAKRMQELGYWARRAELLAAEVVTAAEAHDATPGGVLEVLRLPQRQRPDERKQFGFLSGTDELRLIDESFGRLCSTKAVAPDYQAVPVMTSCSAGSFRPPCLLSLLVKR